MYVLKTLSALTGIKMKHGLDKLCLGIAAKYASCGQWLEIVSLASTKKTNLNTIGNIFCANEKMIVSKIYN